MSCLSRCMTALLCSVFIQASAQAEALPLPESIELAKTVPIADVHMHLVDLSAQEHQAQMDRNGVRWGGGVGRTGKSAPDPDQVIALLGKRYFRGIGQEEFTRVFYSEGADGLLDPESIAFKEMFEVADELLRERRAYGFGELHIDNSKSFSSYQFARRIPFDNPVMRQIYTLANQHGAFVQIHMQADHPENMAALESYLRAFPKAKTVLSHGLGYSKQPMLRALLGRYPNLFLELSRKGGTLNEKEAARVFSREGAPKDFWLKTIEEYPDRFMVGSDTHSPDEYKYDEVMQEFRTSLFPFLKPATLKLVAYGNAIREFRLE